MNTDMNVKINMATQMSNDELRDAIKYAHDTAHLHVTEHPLFESMNAQLVALLEIQRGRAAACSVDNSNPHVLAPPLGGGSEQQVVRPPEK